MQKKTVSYFFLILFTLFIAAPTVISVVEKSIDTSVFYSVNEEENKVNETLKIFEVKLSDAEKFGISIFDLEKEKSDNSYSKNYTPNDLECDSPPPKLS